MAKKVKVYSTPTCPYCKMMKDFLTDKGVEFEAIDVAQDVEARNYIVGETNQMSVPVTEIIEDGKKSEFIIGFDKEKVSESLGL